MVLVKWLKEALEARVKQCSGKTPAKVETARSGQLNDTHEQAAIAKLIAVKKTLTDYKSQELSVTSLALKINANNALATHTYVELRDAYFKELDNIIQQLTDRLNDGKNLKELIYKVTTEPDLYGYRLKLKRGDVDVLFNSSFVDYEDNLHNRLIKIIIDGKDLLDLVVPFNIPKPDETKGYCESWNEPDYEHGFKALGLTVNSQWPKGFNPENEVRSGGVENLYFRTPSQKVLEDQSSELPDLVKYTGFAEKLSKIKEVKAVLYEETQRDLNALIDLKSITLHLPENVLPELRKKYIKIINLVIFELDKMIERLESRKNVRMYTAKYNNVHRHYIMTTDVSIEVQAIDLTNPHYLPIISINGKGVFKTALNELVNEMVYGASKHIGYNVSWLTPETIPNPEDVSETTSTMFNPSSVGEILQEYMGDQSINSLAKSLQTTPTRLKRILNDNALIDMEFAKKLAKHYRTTSQFWMGINNDYQMWLLKNYDEEQEGLETHDDK